IAKIAGAEKFVEISEAMIEGCYLESEKGIAVVLLNWSGEPKQEIAVRVKSAKAISKVESIEQGILKFEKAQDGAIMKLPLKTVDVLMLYF
ncbi:MAG: hypothetical protein ACP5QD_01300, partial [Candidatus Ratteibacteria bacterium]